MTSSVESRTGRGGVALVVVSATGFGTLAVLGEVAFAAGVNIPSLLALRFVLAGVVLWALLVARQCRRDEPVSALRLHGRTLLVALALGALGYTGQSALFFLGLRSLTAGVTTVLLYTYPLFVVVLAVTVLDEPLTRRTLLALPVSLVGVVLVAGAEPASVALRGVVATVGAAAVYSGYITVSRVVLTDTDGVTLAGYVAPAAAASFLLYGGVTDTLALPASATGWAAVLGIALLSTAVPVVAFFGGVRRIGASRAGVVSTVEPVVAVLLGALALGETVTSVTVVGSALVLAGVVLLQSD